MTTELLALPEITGNQEADALAMTAHLAGLFGGDTADSPADSGAPNAAGASTSAPAAAPAAAAPVNDGKQAPAAETTATGDDALDPANTVILAKDGKHTIDYQKLVDARTEAAALKAERDALQAQLAAATASMDTRTTATAPAAAPAPGAPDPAGASDTDPESLFGDYTPEELKRGIDKLVAAQMAPLLARLAPVEAERVKAAQSDHLTTIYTAHPDAESIVSSQEFEAWKARQPSFARDAMERIQDTGNATQIVELLDAYRAANPRQAATAPAPAAAAPAAARPSAAALAAKAIEQAPSRTPNTLTDIPAGGQAHHDPAQAMVDMSATALLDNFMSLTPAQINERLALMS